MKKIHYSILVLIIASGSCKQAGRIKQAEVLTAKQEQIITKEVADVMNATVRRINELNADSVFKDISNVNFSGYINTGTILTNYDSAYSSFKNVYGKLMKLNLVLTDEKYSVLSLNSVLFSAGFRVEPLDINNYKVRYQGAITCVFLKRGENWKIIHIHESLVPGNNKK